MPCEILIVAVAKSGMTERGYPWVVKDTPVVWGNKEVPPNWVVLRITDATKAQVEHYLESWHKKFAYDILQDTPQGYRIRVRVDASMVSASGINRELRADMKDAFVLIWGLSIVNYDNYQITFDVAKPINLQELKDDFHDVYAERFKTKHYYFTDADVDLALAQGGVIELTKAQVLNRIKSRLNE